MGSGETAPTMKAPHRQVFERLAGTGTTVPAIMLDTPFGFQENAPLLAQQTTKYFADSVSRDVAVAGLARTDTGDVASIQSAISRVRDASWVFAGPGSPTFALNQWQRSDLPDVLREKLRPAGPGGALVFSSAAALTLGVATVPVYEIYKVGMDPWWEQGLNLLAEFGVKAAVIPHYDNTEGGNHDTRFCYLGERRLTMLEPSLPDDAFVLGVDEHTGVIIDLDADSAEVVGKGGLTLRRNGDSINVESGRTVGLDLLRSGGASETNSSTTVTAPAALPTSTTDADATADDTSLAARTRDLEADFVRAIDARDAAGAVGAILTLVATIEEWSADTLQSGDMDQARRSLRSMIVKLGDAATNGLREERDVLGPVVQAALDARRVAREQKAFAVSDALRDGLTAAGIEVRDTPSGVEWHIGV